MRSAFLLSLLLLSAQVLADVRSNIDATLLEAQIKERGLCSNQGLSAVCRGMPWIPRIGEGAIDFGGVVYLFIQDPPAGHPLEALLDKFPADKADNWYELMVVSSPAFNAALSKTSFNSVIVLKSTGQFSMRVSSGILISRVDIERFISSYDQIVSEIQSANGEWIPPDHFPPTHEFQSFVQ